MSKEKRILARSLLVVGLAGVWAGPYHRLTAQAVDSTGMPSLELLALDSARAAAITAAFARGLEVPLLAATTDADAAFEFPTCPADLDREAGPRLLVARVTAPLVGMRDGRWEGRLTLELRCRSAAAGSGEGHRTLGKEYLYQWSGRAWRLYQHAWSHRAR